MSVCVEPPSEPHGVGPRRQCTECMLRGRGAFVVAVRQLLEAPSAEISTCIGRCGQAILVGSRHQELIEGAASAVKSEACKFLQRRSIPDVDLFVFVVSCVCQCDSLSSLFCTDAFSPHEPLGGQDKQVWLLCRSMFELHASCAPSAFDALKAHLPQCMAACGFLALCMRTPFALALFLHRSSQLEELTVAGAALSCVDPARRRPVVSVLTRSVVGTTEMFDDGICRCVEACMRRAIAPPVSQAGVAPSGAGFQSKLVEEMAYLNTTEHCPEWGRLVRQARQHFINPNDASGAEAWATVWENISLAAEMCYRVLQRRGTIAFVVVWLHTDKRFVCFSRQLVVTGDYEKWLAACARDVEASVRASFERGGYLLCAPATRSAKRYALYIRDREDRWQIEGCDDTSRAAMHVINQARAETERTCFMMAQGSFRSVLSVCFLSFREAATASAP